MALIIPVFTVYRRGDYPVISVVLGLGLLLASLSKHWNHANNPGL